MHTVKRALTHLSDDFVDSAAKQNDTVTVKTTSNFCHLQRRLLKQTI